MRTPYGRQLSFEELCDVLSTRFECSRGRIAGVGALTDVDGTPTPAVWYFERRVGNKQYQAVVVTYSERQMMTRTVIRSTCAALHIEPDEFKQYLK